MKHIFPILFISSASFAQITVSHIDFAPPGRSFIMAYDTASRQPGNAGVNQMWDFSDAQEIFIDTMAVSDPDTTPYSFYFPSANVCMQPFSAPGYYEYCVNDSTGFYIQGLISVSPNYSDFSVFNPPAVYFRWPMQYGDTFSDAFAFTSRSAMLGSYEMDSMKYDAWYNNRTTVDAWGQLTTSLGTFPVLRQEKFMSMAGSIWSYSAQTGS